MNTYTLNGKEYDLLIQDNSIHLESTDHDLIFPQGFQACKDAARSYLVSLGYGYSEAHVYEIALTYIEDYIKTEVYTTMKHENN